MWSCREETDRAPQTTQSEVFALNTDCSANAISNPSEFIWTYHADGDYYSGELEVSEATFNIGGDTLTTRAYRQPGQPHSIPGPTIKVVPGNKYVLRFHNRLPYEPLSTEHNVFKDPNASNIHTHGLHISGESPGDDVSRTFPGGFGGDFVWDIPADHMGGTYWYHAHHHGSTFLQVSGGTFGMLIVDDAADGLPAHVANMTERELILGYLDPGAAGTGGDTLLSGTLSSTWTINGQKSASLCIPANEWQHWRVLVADRDAKSKTVSFGSGCEVALMARDGVWRTEIPKPLSNNSISLTGASRADFAVRCTSDATISVGNATLGNIIVGASGDSSVHPYADVDGGATWSASRPSYLRDLSQVPNSQINNETIRMGARTVNGSKYDHHNPTLRLTADAVQEWSVSGAAQHPFHLHIYHMQTFGCNGDYEDGEYYDTLGANCNVRFDTNVATTSAYQGKTIMHCHILEHEDQGAMGWLDLVGGIGPPTFPNATPDPAFGTYYALDVVSSCGDGLCATSETSCNCPVDCGAPATSELLCSDGVDNDCDGDVDCADADCAADAACGPSCGDGVCSGDETSCSCADDCGAPPSSELICDDGVDNDCDGDIDCADADCAADAACGPSCGDGVCSGDETSCSCADDCGAPPSSELICDDGVDNDCDGDIDCADADCAADAACAPAACNNNGVCEVGEDCNNCANDCASRTSGRRSSRYCCGDGTASSAEGDGSVCDGNY